MMRTKLYHTLRLALPLVAALVLALPAAAQKKPIRIVVKVVQMIGKEEFPVQNVTVENVTDQVRFGVTDTEGRVANAAYGDVELLFTEDTYKPKRVKVKGREELKVVLERRDEFKARELPSATATGRLGFANIQITTAQAEGNWIAVDLNNISPRNMKSNQRWVVQPVCKRLRGRADSDWKDFTPQTGKVEFEYLTPLIFDRKEYARTQERMHDFDMANDPLTAGIYIVADDSMRQGKWIERKVDGKTKRVRRQFRRWDVDGGKSYYYAPDLRDNYVFYLLMAYEDYNKVLRIDTVLRSVGVSRPWTWLEYDFASYAITDPQYFPAPSDPTPRETQGYVKVNFAVGSSKLNLTDSVNLSEVAKMERDINLILGQDGARLLGVRFEGKASPDGGYDFNARLAEARKDALKNYLRSRVGAKGNGARWGMADETVVATWEELADTLQKDGLTEEAEAILEICGKFADHSVRSRKVSGLPFYDLLKEKYFPRFRTTTYHIDYQIYRNLSIDEIRGIYREKGMAGLDQYEAWQLYSNEPDTVKRIALLREVVKENPSFVLAANDLQVLLIDRGEPDSDLLTRFVQRKRLGDVRTGTTGKLVPAEVFNNHVIAQLYDMRFSAADSVLQGGNMPQNQANRLLRIFVKVLNGDAKTRSENFETIASTTPRNRVIMHLLEATHEGDTKALNCCDALDLSDPVNLYLQAVCQMRLKDDAKAEATLRKAIKIRPELEDAARFDGDLSQLPMFKEEWEHVFKSRDQIEAEEREHEAELQRQLHGVDLGLTVDEAIEQREKAAASAKKKLKEDKKKKKSRKSQKNEEGEK